MSRGPDERQRYLGTFLLALAPGLLAGLLLFGWRAGLVVAGTVAAAMLGHAVWRRVGVRGGRMRRMETLLAATLLACLLPAELATGGPERWPLVPAAGLLLAGMLWLVGPPTRGRVSAVVLAALLLWAGFGAAMRPAAVLWPASAVIGDVAEARPAGVAGVGLDEVWWPRRRTPEGAADAATRPAAADALLRLTRDGEGPAARVARDLPPLVDLLAGGVPKPIGTASVLATVLGGLFLIRRSAADAAVPILAGGVAAAGFLAFGLSAGWGVGLSITFAAYEVAAGPMVFAAVMLAAQPGVRPITRPGRVVFAAVFGAAAAAAQLYVSVWAGPLLGLALAGLLTPWLDRHLRPRPLVR